MLLRYSVKTSAARSRTFGRLNGSPRTIFTETVQILSNAYLELAVALPYPPTWPAYSSTIILVGVVSRLALYPVFVWARERERRVEEYVIPYLKAYRAKLDEKVRREVEKTNSSAAHGYYEKIMREKLTMKRGELLKKHRCTPWVTMVVPPLSQVPIYIIISTIFFRAAREPGSVLRDEAFLTLSSLAQPDPTMTLPIVLGFVSLASIETSSWFATGERERKLTVQQKFGRAQRARGTIVVQPSRHVKSILRGLSVGRIVLAAMAPGSIEVYWLTSATLGLFQNWMMNWNDRRRVPRKGTSSATRPNQHQGLNKVISREIDGHV